MTSSGAAKPLFFAVLCPFLPAPDNRFSSTTIDGIFTRFADERESQHPRESEAPGVPKLGKSDSHTFMPRSRLITISTEQTVPPGQIETKIAVGFAYHHGMMYPMHVRGHHEETELPIDPRWEMNIAMVKHGRGIEENLESKHS